MNKKDVLKAIQTAKGSTKRNFKQSVDLIINLKSMDLKKAENQFDDFVDLPHTKGKKTKVCALVGPELEDNAKKVCDKTIRQDEFQKLNKLIIKKIAKQYDYFIAQANIMANVATTFGKSLGPRGKMPNPKIGCVVPPKADLTVSYNRLQKLVKLSTKKGGSVKTIIGNEGMEDKDLVENIMTAYNHFIKILPNEKDNVKNVLVKLTMGPSIVIGEKVVEGKGVEVEKNVEKPVEKKVVEEKEVKAEEKIEKGDEEEKKEEKKKSEAGVKKDE